jgi:hypothetical protein
MITYFNQMADKRSARLSQTVPIGRETDKPLKLMDNVSSVSLFHDFWTSRHRNSFKFSIPPPNVFSGGGRFFYAILTQIKLAEAP